MISKNGVVVLIEMATITFYLSLEALMMVTA
jgi:hypothetical protein